MVWVIFAIPAAVSAQEPTQTPTVEPTPTSTPAYVQNVTMTSGNVLHVERTITYGDAAVVIVGLLLWVTIILTQMVQIPRIFMRR
jgi:hypothetical protein